jgi:hypothetical protein
MLQNKIDTWYGCRFVNSSTITQFFFDGAGILNPYAHFYNISPEQFEKSTQHYIVAVWHIKPKH